MEPKHAPEQGHNKYTRLAGNTMIFAISSFSSKLLTLIVQPFLTYAMRDVQSMGVSKLLSQCANLLIPLVSMGMSNAIIRFGLDKGNSKKQVFTNGLLTILLGYGVLLLCWPLLSLAPGIGDYGVFLCIYVLTSCLRTLCTQFIRSRQLNRLVGIDGVLCTFATLMFYVLYLVVLDMGAEGYLLAIICGDVTSSLFLFCTGKLWRYIDFRFINRALWREMLRFSLPMIPAQISFWNINASARFFVNAMCEGYGGRTGPEWSGLLSTGYFLPTILNTLGTIFYDAWQLSAVTEEKGRSHFFSTVFRSYASVMFCCAAGILWLCRPVMLIMKSSYFDAWQFVPYLTLAAVFTCFTQFMNSIYVVYKRSTHSLYTMMAGAVANCVMNYLGILWFGPVGVTYASFLAMVLVFVLRAVDSRKLIQLRLHPVHMTVNVAFLVIEAAVTLAEVPFYGLWTGLLCGVVILYNFDGVWAMGRAILPRVLGRRAAPLVAWVDGVVAKVYH